MKKIIFIFIVSQFDMIALFAGCPCDATSPTYTSSAGTDANSYTVTAGQKLYIPSNSTVTGTITLSGGTIVNLGTFSAGTFTWGSGTFDNCGSVTKNFTVPAAATFNNCSNGTITCTSIGMGNTAVFNNSGIVDVSNSSGTFTSGNSSTVTNNSTGSLCVGLTFTVGNACTFTNNGVIGCYDFVFANAGTFYNGCTVVVIHNLTVSNTAVVSGPTSGTYGRFNVTGSTTLGVGSSFGSTASDRLDLCDAGAPSGGWDSKSGTVGAGVTYCSNSGCASVNNCSTTLPIELLYFKAICNTNGTANLSWSTATETNNDFFTLERTKDGINYQTIAVIDGAGNSSRMLNYSFDDNAPFDGISYYRLKQTDFNGYFNYSNTSAVSCTGRSDFGCNIYYVNDSENKLSVIYNCSDYSGMMNVQLINMLGQAIFSELRYSQKGNNAFEIITEHLPSGMYTLKLSNKNNVSQKKFVKPAN